MLRKPGSNPSVVQASIGDFGAQEVSNIAWAFATLGLPDGKLFAALARQAVRLQGELLNL